VNYQEKVSYFKYRIEKAFSNRKEEVAKLIPEVREFISTIKKELKV